MLRSAFELDPSFGTEQHSKRGNWMQSSGPISKVKVIIISQNTGDKQTFQIEVRADVELYLGAYSS